MPVDDSRMHRSWICLPQPTADCSLPKIGRLAHGAGRYLFTSRVSRSESHGPYSRTAPKTLGLIVAGLFTAVVWARRAGGTRPGRSLRFLSQSTGLDPVREVPDYPPIAVSDGTTMLAPWRLTNPATANDFDRRTNIGLRHLALHVADEATLTTVFERVRSHRNGDRVRVRAGRGGFGC